MKDPCYLINKVPNADEVGIRGTLNHKDRMRGRSGHSMTSLRAWVLTVHS
jgi:hypothetical protein